MNNFLPPIDGEFGLKENLKEEKLTTKTSSIVSEKVAYEQFKLDQKQRTGVAKRAESPVITLEMLELAPENFFDKFTKLNEIVSNKIIASISSDDRSIHVSNLKKDPTNNEFKETALYVVISEFAKIDRTDADVRLLPSVDKDILLALVINEIVGLGPLEPLRESKKVTEIICNGPFDIQIEIGGRIKKMPSVKFRNAEHLKSLIDKLYGSINKSLSPVNPRERGRLHDNSRLYAVHQVIAPSGPNFNIRKHPERFWTPLDMVTKGTASKELMTYLGNLIHAGCSFLVVGGTSTGKTSFTNALTGFFKEDDRIITIEENLELKPHPMKLLAAPMECLPAKAGSEAEFGVTMRDLLRSALQMRPDAILFGEVSDGSAYDLCQALNTGHYGGSTLHSNNSEDAMARIASLVAQEEFVKGNAIFDLIGAAFDVLVVIERLDDGSRKVTELVEVGRKPVISSNNELVLETKPLWEFKATKNDENGKIIGSWEQVGDLSDYRKKKIRLDLKETLTWEELLEISTYNIPEKLRGGGV